MARISPAKPERFAEVTDIMQRWKKTKHYSEDAIIEIVAVISLLGWLNRWAQTLNPELEESALAFAQEHLAPSGWTPGAHGKPGV